MKRLAISFLLPIVLTGCTSSKKNDPYGATELTTLGLTLPEGQLMIYNDPGAYFTFLIRGNHIRNTERHSLEDPLALVVDGMFLQMTTLPISQFIDSNFSRMSDQEILEAHVRYESQYLASLIDKDYKIYREPLHLDNGRESMLWMMEIEGMPTQVLISTAVRPRILLLSTALLREGEKEQKRVLGLLMEGVGSIRRYDKPIDRFVLQDSIVKAAAVTTNASSGGD